MTEQSKIHKHATRTQNTVMVIKFTAITGNINYKHIKPVTLVNHNKESSAFNFLLSHILVLYYHTNKNKITKLTQSNATIMTCTKTKSHANTKSNHTIDNKHSKQQPQTHQVSHIGHPQYKNLCC